MLAFLRAGLAPAARVVPRCTQNYEKPVYCGTVRAAQPKPDVVFKEFLLSLVPHVRDWLLLVQSQK
jgi:hypothetical protein